MPRSVLRLAALCLLLLAGTASALLAATPRDRTQSTSGGTTTGTATSTVTTSWPLTNTSPTVLAFTGHGWGHGLGLSQWGAYGYALHGWTYDRILAHYYPGTALGAAAVTRVRVLVFQGKRVTLSATAPWAVSDATGARTLLDAATPVQLGASLTLDGVSLVGPLAASSAQPLRVNGVAYRGKLTVSGDGKTLQVVDTLGLDAYLKGVVAQEMSTKWPAAALQAQAVASRTYALANLQKHAPFDLYGDGRSQVYGGVAAETAATTAAVDATKGQVVLWNGKPADALYSSTSGGRTASADDVLGVPIPYLVSVPDPYDTLSPLHNWGPILVSGDTAAKALKLPDGVQGLVAATGSDGRVKSVVATSPTSFQVTVSGSQARVALGLPSTWFSAAVLGLQPRSKTVPFGGAVSLTGFLHGPGTLSLEAKETGGVWLPAGNLPLDATGAFAVGVAPQLGTQYRLAWGSARIGLAKVGVSVVVSAAIAPGAVSGSVTPAVAGAPVQLQQQTGTTWTTVAATTTDAAGAWSFAQALQPGGTYRVRSAPGHGLAAGLSAPLLAP